MPRTRCKDICTGEIVGYAMSRRGDCYDNVPMKSFWGTLKTELTFHRHYQTRQELYYRA